MCLARPNVRYLTLQIACMCVPGCPVTQLREVAGDLALAVAVAASFFNTLVPRDLVVLGEVGARVLARA